MNDPIGEGFMTTPMDLVKIGLFIASIVAVFYYFSWRRKSSEEPIQRQVCNNCGAEVGEEARYCTICGTEASSALGAPNRVRWWEWPLGVLFPFLVLVIMQLVFPA